MKTTLHFNQKNARLILTAVLLATVVASPGAEPRPGAHHPPPTHQPTAVTPPATDTACHPPPPLWTTSLAAALRTMSFDRSPEALLAATRAQRKSGKTTEAESFRMAVLLGDWAGVGTALAALPPEDAAAGYARLLDALAGNSIAVGEVLKPAPPGSNNPGDPNYRRASATGAQPTQGQIRALVERGFLRGDRRRARRSARREHPGAFPRW